MSALLSVFAQYGPSLDDQIPHDAPNDLLPEPVNSLVWLAVGVGLVLGRDRIADLCASVTGWGHAYRRFCERACAVWGAVLVIAVIVNAVRLLL
jgi:hypothetical protein